MNRKFANAIRFLSVDAVEKAKSGHPGMPMGMADIATVLFTEFIKINPKDPDWFDRDRFVLSNGHGSMLIYSLLYLLGYKEPTITDIKNFRKVNSKTPGHPEFRHTKGIETTTGPLGQGLGNAVGMALAEKILSQRFTSTLVNHLTYVFAGDGCLMEGISHEVLSFAGHHKLNKLIVFYDDNKISIDGPTDLSFTDDTSKRIKSYNWNYIKINGHDYHEIRDAIRKAKKSKKPTMIGCRTTIGFGSPNKQGSHESHGAALGKDEINLTRENLNWNYKPFFIPKDIKDFWNKAGLKSLNKYKDWKNKIKKNKNYKEFRDFINFNMNSEIEKKIISNFALNTKDISKISTRKASQLCLDSINSIINNTLGGSADLTPSNNTKSKNLKSLKNKYSTERYIHYGVREHGMASIMNGLALHSKFIPYGGTFLVFSDYCRPSIRLSALMNNKVIYVMTHDSIALGEDGPTHQPIEQLMSLRLIPNLKVYRPCDLNETMDSWINALNYNGPSVIALSRQDLPVLNQNLNKRQVFYKKYLANIIYGDLNKRDITLVASGSEVELALKSAEILKTKKIRAVVISIPCIEDFIKNKKSDIDMILGKKNRIFIEAGVSTGWKSLLSFDDNTISIDSFGASGPKDDVLENFDFTVKNVVKKSVKLFK